jgi:hypothetical protein
MRASRIASIGAAAIALAGAAPAAAQAGSWTAPRAATDAGQSFEPSVAADSRGRIALGFARHLDGRNRAEIRQGSLREGLRGASALIDSLPGNLDGVTVGLRAGSPGPDVVWRRYGQNAQRLFATSVRTGSAKPWTPFPELTTGPSSGYEPRWVDGADGVRRIVYDMRTTSAFRDVTDQPAPHPTLPGTVYGPASPLPGTGISSQPRLAVAADGTRIVAWQSNGRILTARAAPGGAFGAAIALPTAGYARDVQLAQGADGTIVIAWLASTGQGNAVQIASRPSAGAFGAPVTVVPGPEGAYEPRLVATSAGEILLGWTATGRTSGYASSSGTLRLQRLSGRGAPVGAILTLTPSGTRAAQIVLAHDGTGSVLAAWARVDGGGRRTVQARRIAPGGIVGVVRNLSPRAGAQGGAPVLAGASGDAVAAWTSPTGKTVYSIYR